MDQAGMAEKPVEDAQRRYGAQRVEGVLMTPAVRLELVGAFKRRFEDTALRIPKSTAIRQNLHAVRRAAGPTGAHRSWWPPTSPTGTPTASGPPAAPAPALRRSRRSTPSTASTTKPTCRPAEPRAARPFRWRGTSGTL